MSKGECYEHTASDFIGTALGDSEQQTKHILAESQGCVCLIDEAYGLHAGKGMGGSISGGDPYRTAVIDTLVEEVSAVHANSDAHAIVRRL